MKRILVTYRYEIIAALSGAVVMMLELVGARMVAPYFGTSMYVWTAMIGVILGSLSLGYWYGGKIADTSASDRGLAVVLIFAALLIGACVILQEFVLAAVAATPVDIRIQAIMAALILFAPASALLGIVSPYVVKLKLSSLSTAGSSVGRLYAAGTAGSIIGTFASGYWLISWFGNYTLGILLVLLLVAVSFVAHQRTWFVRRLVFAIGVLLLLIMPRALPHGIIADVDSVYNRYRVSEITGPGYTLRQLLTDNRGAQSAYVLGRPDISVFEYIKTFKKAADAYGPLQNMLMIGGGMYTFPSQIALQQPRAQVQVVEIDPKSDELAKQYFEFQSRPNLHIAHQDGRVFLNRNQHAYDMVYLDAFSSLSPPYQLTTIEASRALRHATKSNGVAMANVVARPTSNDPYFAATYRTYKQAFEVVRIYRMRANVPTNNLQNLVFVMGSASAVTPIAKAMKAYTEPQYPTAGMILRDDHAPVDQLISADQT